MDRNGRNVKIVIHHLVVHGMSNVSRPEAEAALRKELGRMLLAAPPAPASSMRIGRIQSAAHARPKNSRELGQTVARAIHGALPRS